MIDPAKILTQTEPLADAIEAYKAFDRRQGLPNAANMLSVYRLARC